MNGVETSRGRIHAGRTLVSVAGHSSHVARMAGLRLPIESHLLQAFVTEPIKPFLDCVLSFGAELFYISQSDKGGMVFGGHIDGFNTYTQRGQFPKVQTVAECAVALIPGMSRLRLLRHWAGIQDMTPDGSPFMGRTPLKNLYLNGGWCYQGFKATPAAGWCMAHTLAHDDEHPLIRIWRSIVSSAATARRVRTGPLDLQAIDDVKHPLPSLRPPRLHRVPLWRGRNQAAPGTRHRRPAGLA